MNITMYLPSWELGEPTWRVQQLATGPITEVQLGPAPHPFVVFRDLGDFDTMIGVLVGARAAHGEALSRHAARPLVPELPLHPLEVMPVDADDDRSARLLVNVPLPVASAQRGVMPEAGNVSDHGQGHPGDDEAQDAADRALRRAGVNPADLAELRGEDG